MHDKGACKTKRQSGFTLLELILAISILSIMLTLSYQVLIGILKSKQVLDDKREGMYIANSLLTRISKELQLAAKRPLLPACDTGTSAQNGSQGQNRAPYIITQTMEGGMSLSFIAQEAGQYIPDGGTHSGLVQITYRPAKPPSEDEVADKDIFYLIREEIPYTKPLETACKNALRFPIANNLTQVSFKFYDAKNKAWMDTWSAENSRRLPSIIQFTAVLQTPLGKRETYTSAIKLHEG
jgi:type II secretion system protein J